MDNKNSIDEAAKREILFHVEIVDREFGSALLNVESLLGWVNSKGLHLVTKPPIKGFEFVQVEALLCAIERAASDGVTQPLASAIVKVSKTLAGDAAADIAPGWVIGADAHQQWRKVIGEAAQHNELALLDFGSKLPINTAPAQTAPPAPVVANSNSTTPDPERRLARLRELGGNATYKRGEWKITGILALVASEKSENRKRSDEKTIRADLKEAEENEREAKRANAFSGLGQR